LPKKNKRATAALGAIVENEENEESHVAAKGDDPCYDYLLSMSIDTLNVEKMQKLIAEREINNEVKELEKTSAKSLWLRKLKL